MNENQNLEKKNTVSTLTTIESVEQLEKLAEKIAKSGMTPLKTGASVLAAVLFGKELGFDPMVSANNIYPINGKATAGIHLINSLLLKAGIVTKIIRNYEPCVGFALKGENGKAVLLDSTGAIIEYDNDGKPKAPGVPQILREGFADEEPRPHELKGSKITNWKTVVEMSRKLKQDDGTFKDMSVQASFSIKDAQIAELYPKKDNWKNYPSQMCLNRACAFAGRLIGADILLGLYETSELADTHNIPYILEGETAIINENNKDKTTSEPSITDAKFEEVKDNADNTTNNPQEKI